MKKVLQPRGQINAAFSGVWYCLHKRYLRKHKLLAEVWKSESPGLRLPPDIGEIFWIGRKSHINSNFRTERNMNRICYYL